MKDWPKSFKSKEPNVLSKTLKHPTGINVGCLRDLKHSVTVLTLSAIKIACESFEVNFEAAQEI